MQEIQLMKEMEALRAQLQQKEQALEDYKESDLYLPLGILGLLQDWTVPGLLREPLPKFQKKITFKGIRWAPCSTTSSILTSISILDVLRDGRIKFTDHKLWFKQINMYLGVILPGCIPLGIPKTLLNQVGCSHPTNIFRFLVLVSQTKNYYSYCINHW